MITRPLEHSKHFLPPTCVKEPIAIALTIEYLEMRGLKSMVFRWMGDRALVESAALMHNRLRLRIEASLENGAFLLILGDGIDFQPGFGWKSVELA
jgi:hypothetical protein